MKVRLSIAAIAATALASVSFLVSTASAATLFSDNFEDGETTGWSKSGGEWSVAADGSQTMQQTKPDSELARMFAGNTAWTNYTVSARVKPTGFSGAGSFAGIAARASGSTKMYRLVLLGNNRAELQYHNGGQITVIGGANLTVSTGSWYTLQITVSGSNLTGRVNGATVGSGSDSAVAAGRVAALTNVATARFDDVLVTDAAGPGPTTTAPPTSSPPNSPTPSPTGNPIPPGGLVGWATQGGGTTGGSGGSTVTVSNLSALTTELNAAGTRIIRVSGTISCAGMLQVSSNKSILGNSGATIAGCGLNISEDSNVIVRNISFRDWDDDAINVQYSTRVWIDHNSFTNGFDGAVDIKRASDFVTVSWNRFFGHEKTMLLGHSDDNASEDVGHLRVTYHHNWFDGTNSRHPRVRFGNPVHVYNNYYNSIGDYGVASTEGAGVLVEGNYFENTDDPFHRGEGSSSAGNLLARNNFFVGSGAGDQGGSVASIPYSYNLETPSNVKASVTAAAGAGRISV